MKHGLTLRDLTTNPSSAIYWVTGFSFIVIIINLKWICQTTHPSHCISHCPKSPVISSFSSNLPHPLLSAHGQVKTYLILHWQNRIQPTRTCSSCHLHICNQLEFTLILSSLTPPWVIIFSSTVPRPLSRYQLLSSWDDRLSFQHCCSLPAFCIIW